MFPQPTKVVGALRDRAHQVTDRDETNQHSDLTEYVATSSSCATRVAMETKPIMVVGAITKTRGIKNVSIGRVYTFERVQQLVALSGRDPTPKDFPGRIMS